MLTLRLTKKYLERLCHPERSEGPMHSAGSPISPSVSPSAIRLHPHSKIIDSGLAPKLSFPAPGAVTELPSVLPDTPCVNALLL